jgi:hypothetical protein
MIIIVVVCTLVFLCFSSMQHLQQATALVLQDSLLEFNQNEDKNDYDGDENLVYTNIVTSTSSNSEPPSLLQTSSNKINFDNVMNLTNNPHDSVYGQVDASSENDVYVVWQDSVPGSAGNYKNYDIFFTKSSDAGTSFGREINLSNNSGFSEHPQLATSGNNVYVAWADNSLSVNREIFFVRSTDGGNTFGNPINLSNNLGDSYNHEIFVFGDDIYAVWLDKEEDHYESENSHSNILIKSSIDGGATFGQTLSLSSNNSNNSNANTNSFPKVAAYNNHVYVIWNVEENTEQSSSEERSNSNNNTGLYFAKSSDRAASFGESIRVDHPDQEFGEAQIAASGQHVYIVWGGSHLNKVSDLSFIKSTDNGDIFSDPISITDNDNNNNFNPSNVEISVDKVGNSNDNVYIAWQSLVSAAGQNNKEEVLFTMSSDGGNTFGDTVNLSKNHDISECPSLTIYGGKIYVVWEDLSPGNHEILFTKSI